MLKKARYFWSTTTWWWLQYENVASFYRGKRNAVYRDVVTEQISS